jgi:hypothetical protein
VKLQRYITRTAPLGALALAGTLVAAGCSPQEQRMQQAGEARAAGQPDTDPAASRRTVTLTGCLQRGLAAGEYNLMSVATGGVIGTTGEGAQDTRQGAAPTTATPESQARLQAESSYRLVDWGDENLEQYVNTRVRVNGLLASEVPATTSGNLPETGKLAESTAQTATVVGEAQPLPGFYVRSVRKVADTCTPE